MKSLLALLLFALGIATSVQGQLFTDNFTRGTDPGPLTPWLTNAGGGNWTVTGGVMRGGPNPTFTYGFAYITNRYTNYSVQAKIQFPAGAYGGGLGGRLDTATGTRYAAWVYPENSAGGSNVLKLLKFLPDTSFSVLQQTNLASVGTTNHTLKLEFASANQVNIYYDSNKLVSATDPTPYASGSVDLEFWTDTAGYQLTVDDVTVSAIPLVGSNDTYTAVSGIALKTNAPGVLANDSGGNGPLTAILVSNPTHGTLTLTNNGGFTYNATAGYTGADSFTYRATDGVSTSGVVTASITVTADHAPVANNDAYSMVQDTTLTATAPGVLGNDTDVDGNSLTAAVVTGVAHGTLNLSANGGFTYTPAAGYSGTDSFTYRANDGISNSTSATVTISILSIVPLYTDSFTRASISPWTAQSGNWAISNNALVGGTNTLVSYGVAYVTNSFTNYSVQATVQLPAGAFGGGIDACLNPATGARYSAWIYPEASSGGSLSLKLIKFQDYANFAYNGSVSTPMESTSLTSVGTIPHTLKLACAGNRVAVFFDNALMISVTDVEAQPYFSGGIAADFWTPGSAYQMTVDDVLVARLVNGDNYSTATDSALTVAAPGVLANDTEIAGVTLTAVRVAGPLHGILNLSSDGSFSYTATNNYTGPDSFTYQATDAGVNLGTATVSLTVLPTGFAENFDGVTAPALPSGWTSSATGGETAWVTRSTTSDTAPNSAFAPDPASVGSSTLVSPSIVLPSGQARLSFRSNYRLEADATTFYDGGVLEIKIGAGSFTDILAAGGSFVTNGYDGVISSAFSNPLAGRQAWSGDSGGFITTLVNLPAAAMGQTIQLRWICGTDNGNGNNVTNGWYVDTVTITNCACACCWNTPPLLGAQTDQTVNELTLLTVSNPATDADLPAQTLTYSLISPPAGATIVTNTGVITWSPTQAQSPSTNLFQTRVIDSGSPALSATNLFDVVVREVNVPPTLPTIATQIVNELSAMTVTNTATNANIHSTISGYRLVAPVPAGLVIGANGVITWLPDQTQSPSTNPVTTIVTNSNPYDLINPRLTATNTFWVVVREVNLAPTLPTIPPQMANVQTLMTVTNTATNANIHSTITGYRLVTPPTPSGVSISPAGIITWSPTALQSPSTNFITTVVTNSNPYDTTNPRLTATNTFTVYVNSGALVTLNSTALIGEGFLPTNNAIDPGETVSLRFGLKNTGGANTTNLVATLLQTNGVSAPSAPQTYGALVAGGAEVTRAFSFTVSGTCGSTVIPTLQLQDGPTNYGTVSASYALGQNGTIITQNFDSVTIPALPSGWTTNGGGGPGWITTNTSPDTAPNVAFVPDASVVSSNDLVSPQILLPLGQSTLSFRHTYSLESDTAFATNGFDGGVLEIKIGTNLNYVDITNSGGVFVANGYNRKIDTRYSSPISGRWAWSGTNGGYVTTTVTLPSAAAGQTIQLRWRCATDNGNGGGGWRVDSIGITGAVCDSNIAPTLPTQTNRTIFELTSLTVTNTATDPESPPEVLSYTLAVGPTNADISTNGVITWTPTEEQGPGTYTFTTVVSDNSSPSAQATNTFQVTVNESNSAPTLTLPASQTINELVPWSANATGTDTDSPPNSLTFELVSGPTGLTVSAAGLIEWTPSEAQGPGTYPVLVRVFDNGSPVLYNTNTFTLTVNEVNSAPTLTLPASQTINELVPWSASATGIDTDSPPNSLTFELVSGPTGLTVSAAGLIEWTPSETQGPGTYPVLVRVFDNGLPVLYKTNTFTLTVNEVNSAPTLTLPANQTIDELVAWSASATGTDTDSPPNSLSFELVSGPSGLTVSAAGLIEWTPSEAQGPGTYPVKVRVFDNGSPILSTTNSFTLTVNEVNSAPTLALPANQTIDELVAWSANATGTDTDSPPNSLTFELVSGPTGLTVSAAGLIEWTPSEAQGPGTYPVLVRVFDNGSPVLYNTNTFTLTVNEVNSAPTLTVPASQTINELVPWSANATGSDTDSPPNNLTIELVSGPSGLTVSAAGLIDWTPAQTQSPSTNNVLVRVFDDGSPIQSTTNSFTLTVREVNVAPSLPVIPDQTLTSLALLTVTNTATNANIHSTITAYTLVNPPEGAAIDANGIITWTPSQAQNGTTNTISTVVTNANPYDLVNPQLTASNSFEVVVNAPETTPPAIQSIEVTNGMVIVTWSTISGRKYHLQTQDTVGDTNWSDVPPEVLATGSTASATNGMGVAPMQFYRIQLMP